MNEDERYKLGERLGHVILSLFDLLAWLDGTDRQEAIEGWISAYITERIAQGDGE